MTMSEPALGRVNQKLPLEALRRAAVRATLAPSVHNTQPWRFVLTDGMLSIVADFSRQLLVLDPSRRQLFISCGCALLNARVSLAADGFDVDVRRLPDPAEPDVVAQLVNGSGHALAGLGSLDHVVGLRRTNRRRFATDPVPNEVLDALITLVEEEECELFPILREEHRIATAILSQRADAMENADPAYRAELRAWVGIGSVRRDGVPTSAIPHFDGLAHDDIPVRDFDVAGLGELPGRTESSLRQSLLVLGSRYDNTAGWVRVGEALERLWLESTRRGLALSLFTQVIEVPSTRAQLRLELGLAMQPMVLIRLGRAAPTPAPRRRRLVDVLVEEPLTT